MEQQSLVRPLHLLSLNDSVVLRLLLSTQLHVSLKVEPFASESAGMKPEFNMN